MTALEYQEKFNRAYLTASKLNNVKKSSKRLLSMLDTLNRMRKVEGIEPLSLPHLESYRLCER